MSLFGELWPRARKDVVLNPPRLFEAYREATRNLALPDGSDLGTDLLALSRFMYEDLERKQQNTFARASPTLTTIGLGLALFGGLAALVGQQTLSMPVQFEIGLMLLALIYFFGAIIAVLKVFGPSARSLMDPTDLVPLAYAKRNEYILRISRRLLDYTTGNFKVHNEAVENINVSQRRLRNGLFVLGIAVAILLVTRHAGPTARWTFTHS